jgi:hypothetical protein
VWPDLAAEWRDVDRPPDSGALAAAEAMFLRLVQGDPDDPWLFRFGPEAQELFNAWRAELERRVRGDDMHPALTAHLAKYRSLMPSPALRAAAELGRRIAGGWRAREETFTVRDVYRPQWSGLDTPELARTAIGVLEDAGWARRIALDYGADGGRPSEAYSINPRTRRKKE